MRPLVGLLLIAVTFPLASCAAGPASGSSSPSSNVITPQQLDEVQANAQNVWEAIERLRPNWLVSRASTMRERIDPVTYVDGRYFGDLESLRRIGILEAREVRRLSAHEATLLYGTGHAGGVIAVSTGR